MSDALVLSPLSHGFYATVDDQETRRTLLPIDGAAPRPWWTFRALGQAAERAGVAGWSVRAFGAC